MRRGELSNVFRPFTFDFFLVTHLVTQEIGSETPIEKFQYHSLIFDKLSKPTRKGNFIPSLGPENFAPNSSRFFVRKEFRRKPKGPPVKQGLETTMARLHPSQSQFKRGDGMTYLSSSWVTITQLNAIVVIDLRIQFLVVTLAFMLWIVRTKP